MDNSLNEKLGKYFRIIFVCVFLFTVSVLIYRQFIYLPHKQKDYILQHTPTVIEERNSLTPAEDKEMRAVYEELMLKKYGKKVDMSGVASSSVSNGAVSPVGLHAEVKKK